MMRKVCILALLLAAPVLGIADDSYLTGKLVRVESTQAAGARMYALYIQQGETIFSVRIVEKPRYRLEWQLNGPIEFRLDNDAIYLKRPNGGTLKIARAESSLADGIGPTETLDLPFPSAERRSVQTPPAAPQMPGCIGIAAQDPQLNHLAKVCEFALSGRTLPNFFCQETVQRAVRDLPNGSWEDLDVVRMEATFEMGRGDRYSQVSVDGQAIALPPDIQGHALAGLVSQQHPGGWWTGTGFGSELADVFVPRVGTSFKFASEVNLPSGPSTKFDFQYHAANSRRTIWSGERSFHPGMTGSLWIDRQSGELLRLDTVVTEFPPEFPLSYYSSSMNYGDVSIADIGSFLLPTDGAVVACNRGRCSRDILSFHDCRKFGAEVHIVGPSTEEHH